ncbi:MAG: hypothetical protein WCA83_05000 [Azonexus sp.]
MSVNKLSAGLILLLAGFAAQAAPAGPGRFYCCEGGRVCGDSFPVQCRGKSYTILDSSGLLIKEVGPPLTAEQKAQLAAEAQRKKELDEQAREQRRQDQALLDTYATPRDIDMAQEKAEADVNLAIKAAEERIAAARKQRKKFEQEAEFYKNKALPAVVAKGLRDGDHEIKTQQELLDVKKGDYTTIKAKYDADRKRYNELTGRTSAAAASSKTGKPATH